MPLSRDNINFHLRVLLNKDPPKNPWNCCSQKVLMIGINDQIQNTKFLQPGNQLKRRRRNAVASRGYWDKHIFLCSPADCPKMLSGMENSIRADEESGQGNNLWCQIPWGTGLALQSGCFRRKVGVGSGGSFLQQPAPRPHAAPCAPRGEPVSAFLSSPIQQEKGSSRRKRFLTRLCICF